MLPHIIESLHMVKKKKENAVRIYTQLPENLWNLWNVQLERRIICHLKTNGIIRKL